MDLEKQVKSLEQELQTNSEALELSGKIGNTLLEQIKDLEEELEKISQTHADSIEELEQQNYSLRLKLSAKDKLEASHILEIESLKVGIENENVKKEERLKSCHEREMRRLQETSKELQSDLEKAETIKGQLKEKVDELQKLLKESNELLKSQTGVSKNETTEMNLLKEDMQEEKVHLRIELEYKKDELLHLAESKVDLEQQMSELKDELMQNKKESTSYYNALEKCREEVLDLQQQLDNVKFEKLHTEQKGNSLFGEVDDKRKEIERKHISLKVQFDGNKKLLTMKKQQINKMKFQIATLLQMSGSRTHSSHMDHLRSQLNQRQFEVKTLMDKLKNFEQKQVSSGDDLMQLYNEVNAGSAEETTFTDYLKQLLATNNNKMSEVKKELQTQRMLLIAKNDSFMTCERKLYASQVLVDQQRAKNIKLVLKIDELKRKIAPETEITKQECTRFVIEKLPIKPEDTDNEVCLSEQKKRSSDVLDDGEQCETILKSPKKSPLNTLSQSLTKKTKRSVTVAETVKVFTETGKVDQIKLRLDDDCQRTKVKEPETVGKKGSKKHHKVMFVKPNTNECAQQ